MGSGLSNNQVYNYRMCTMSESERLKTDPSEYNGKVLSTWEDTQVCAVTSRIKPQTNLIDMIKSPSKLRQQPYSEYVKTNLIDLFKERITEVSVIKTPKEVDKQLLLKPRRSFQAQQTLEVVQTSKLEKSINEDGHSQINQYTIIGALGQGAFGKVKQAKNFKGEYVAIKIANKKKLKKKLLAKTNAYTMLEREIAIMKKICHPNVVQLFEVIDDPSRDKLYLVMQYMGKGAILSKGFFRKRNMILDDSYDHQMTEQQCRHFFRQFVLGLDYLHEVVNVIHRDIKPENLLVSEDDVLKIADFGVSHIMEGSDSKISNQQGTQAYLAPEVFQGSNFEGKPVDIWAGGVTLYQMVYGRLPFPSSKIVELKQQITESTPDYMVPKGFSKDVVTLLKGLLDKDPQQRLTIDQIMIDPWLTEQGKSPLFNEFTEYEDINENDIRCALTTLNVQIAMKIVVKMLSMARKARNKVLQRKQNQSIKN